MSNKAPVYGESPYVASLRQQLNLMKGEGVGTFTAAFVTSRLGRKVTQHTARAFKDFEREGLIAPYRYYTERGGLAKAYYFVQQQQLPGMSDEGKPF